jgi:Leucine-rich repeat (LRR) protein
MKRWHVALALVAIALAITNCEANTDEEAADWFVQKAKKLTDAGSHTEAIEELNKSIKIVPGHQEAHLLRGDAYFAIGDKTKALSDYQVAARLPESDQDEEEGEYELDDEVDGDDDDSAAAPAVRKKKKKIGEMHQNADSLQIGFGEGEAEDNSDDEYEYEESTYSPPPPDDNEVAWVSNPHPSLWPAEPRPQLDISEVWFRDSRDANKNHGYTADTDPLEVKALHAVYNDLQGDSWIMNAHWGEGDPCKNMWWGVECAAKPGTATPTVTGLLMQGNALNGTIPVEIGNLPSLKKLLLKSNTIRGNLPKEISQLSQMVELKLGENKIGVVLAYVSGMKFLKSLDLGENFVIGDLSALITCEELEEIRISGSWDGLRGTIPDGLGNLKKLKKLNLGGGQLMGTIPDTLGHLEELKLDRNELEGTIPPSLLASTTLHKLDLNHNFMWGDITIPDNKEAWSKLRILNLGQNNFTVGGAGSPALKRIFGNAAHLQAVELSNNPLAVSLPEEIGTSPHLHTVRAHSCHLVGALPESLGKLQHVREIILHNNDISGPIPESIASAHSLVTFRMYNNELSGDLPAVWKTLVLKRFDVHQNKLTGPVPDSLLALDSLKELYLDTNQFDKLGSPARVLERCSMEGNKVAAPAECDHPKIDRPGPRKFRICDTRVEVYVDVLRDGYGWKETHGNDWDAAFGECYGGSQEYRHMRSNQKIMELPDLEMIWDKGKYAASMERFRRTTFEGESLAKFMTHIPRSFILPSQQQEFDDYYATLPAGSWWLLKPRASCCGRGIKLINETSEIPRGVLGVGEGYIVQKFLHNPYVVGPGLTTRNDWWHTGIPNSGIAGPKGTSANQLPGGGYAEKGYKFVIRLFVVATSMEPLQMYTYPDGLLFWTRGPHSTSSKDWKDRANFITDYFFTDAQNNLQLTLSELRNLMKQHGVDEQKYWAQVKEVTTRAMLPVTHRIMQQESKFISRRGGGYHVWGYDIATDEDLNPMVLEINAHPNTDLEIVKVDREPDRINMIRGDRDLVMGLTDHMVRLIGLFDESEGKEAAAAAVTVQEKIAKINWHMAPNCPASAERCLSEQDVTDLIHAELEEVRRGPMERSFPTCSQKHLRPMLMKQLPRSEMLLDYWTSKVGDCGDYNEDGSYKDGRAPFISARNKKRFSRDEL